LTRYTPLQLSGKKKEKQKKEKRKFKPVLLSNRLAKWKPDNRASPDNMTHIYKAKHILDLNIL
jgi:hypothetical protein